MHEKANKFLIENVNHNLDDFVNLFLSSRGEDPSQQILKIIKF